LEVALLRGRKIVIEKNQLGLGSLDSQRNLFDLPRTGKQRRVGSVPPSHNGVDDFSACPAGKHQELVSLRLKFRVAKVNADNDDPRQGLDLGRRGMYLILQCLLPEN